MNEIRLANYALVTIMLITMATFCASVNALTKLNTDVSYSTTSITLANANNWNIKRNKKRTQDVFSFIVKIKPSI